MNIEEKLKEIGKYFCDKVITGDYKFIACTEHTALILIDAKYEFEIWIANTAKDNLNFYIFEMSMTQNAFYNYLNLNTQKDRIKAWSKLKPHVVKYRNNILKKQKQKEINRLKKELTNLEPKT